MDLKIIYEDNDLLVVDKPAGIIVFPEGKITEDTLIDILTEKYPELKNAGEMPRYGIVHRLDKDTSGILLVAKNNENLIFLQKQFKNRKVEKKYTALITGLIKDDRGTIHTLIGRSPQDPRKQKAYSLEETNKTDKREAITEYRVLERFAASPKAGEPHPKGRENYTLLEVKIKTGRKHQIRCHLSYIRHPIAGDKTYGFKDSPIPKDLNRQFLHAAYIKIKLPSGNIKEFNSELPSDLKNIINNLEKS